MLQIKNCIPKINKVRYVLNRMMIVRIKKILMKISKRKIILLIKLRVLVNLVVILQIRIIMKILI